ncbi:MAG: GatB/YqeY domain-containing protein [Syntrophomonadaceae bacterium]|nr:GatB/YqeY domain-containing protein [Syntrophomonadaceae bacterium]
MSLLERLDQDLKDALKQREAGRLRLSVIRMAKAALQNARIEKGRALTEEEVVEVLAREMKLRRESMVEFEKAQRSDRVEQLRAEMAVLAEYLPQQLSEAEIRVLVKETVARIGAQGPKAVGPVMAALMPQVKGKADGRLVNRIVNEVLAGNP